MSSQGYKGLSVGQRAAVIALLLCGAAVSGLAQVVPPVAPPPTTAFDNIQSSFQAGASTWLARLSGIAQRLFITLGSIEVAVSGALWALRRESTDEIAARFLVKFIVLSFMLTLITAFGYWLPPLVNSFADAGERAIGAGLLSPSTIIDTGISLAGRILSAVKWLGVMELPVWITTGLFAACTAFVVELAYTVIAAMVLLAWIEGFIALGGGVLFLGFAASRWSAAYAENFLNYVVSIGIRIFVLYLVVGIGMAVTNDMLTMIADERTLASDLTPLGQVLGTAIVFAIVAVRVPLAVAGRVTAQHSFGLAQALRSL
jgi:type IV secretion system protein TrbL